METLNLEQLLQIEEAEFLGTVIDPLDIDPSHEPTVEPPITPTQDEDPPADDDDLTRTPETPPTADDPDLTGMFELYKSQGVLKLPEDFAFDNTPEGFQKALEVTQESLKKEATESLRNAIPEEFRDLLSYIMAGGRDLNSAITAFDPTVYDGVDLNDEDTQRDVIYNYYKSTTSMSDDKIASMMTNLAKIGNLKEEAEDAIAYLKDLHKEQQKAFVTRQQEADEAAKTSTAKFVADIDTVLASSESIPQERKNKVKNFMFSQVTRSDKTSDSDFNRAIRSVMSKPDHYVQLADILMDYDADKGFSFDRFISKGKSSANAEFRKKLDDALSPKDKLNKSNPAKSDVAQIDWSKLLKQID